VTFFSFGYLRAKVRRRLYQALSFGTTKETSRVKCSSFLRGRRVFVKLGVFGRTLSPFGKMLKVMNLRDGCSINLLEVR
jgi:hypothetical protein